MNINLLYSSSGFALQTIILSPYHLYKPQKKAIMVSKKKKKKITRVAVTNKSGEHNRPFCIRVRERERVRGWGIYDAPLLQSGKVESNRKIIITRRRR